MSTKFDYVNDDDLFETMCLLDQIDDIAYAEVTRALNELEEKTGIAWKKKKSETKRKRLTNKGNG
jgi:hypothetical protein